MNVLPGKTTAILLSSAALFTAGLWLGHRLTRAHYQGIIARQALRFTEERRKLNEAAAQAWIDAERKVLSAERQKEKALSKIDHQYQQELQHAKAQNARTLADLDTARRLYIVILPAACSGRRLPASSSTSGVDHDPTRAELSEQAARFLVQLAFESDQAVRQLTACQNVVRADREVQASPR